LRSGEGAGRGLHGRGILSKPVIIGIAGATLDDAEAALLRLHRPRGVILFSRNIKNKSQLSDLTGAVRAVLPPDGVLMVDQEGGRVARLRAPHWPDLPAASALKTAEAAFAHGEALGEMAREAGFDVVAAPVLDLAFPGASSVIGDRALSQDPRIVAELGAKLAEGILAQGMIPVMKHLPGHGRALVDSHFALPRVDAPQEELEADFYPFRANRNLPWAMTAHIVYPALDPELPATLSPAVISRVIRGVIGFKGVLVSDDLAMEALAGTPAERAAAALKAGCDIALYCPGDMAGNVAVLEGVRDAA
jgi:beta-N-acetylhexosaminidase